MKKITLLTFATVLFLSFTSCQKDDTTTDATTTTGGTTAQTSQYYITYKANGTAVTETEVAGSRGTSASPRTLTITGNGAAGTTPKFKFFTKETFIGFVPGLSIGNNSGTTDNNYVEYTNSASLLHTTTLDKTGISVGITELSYTNGGNAKGTFDGSIKAANGSTVLITEGKFNVKFSN
ncbi:MAG: hypothetical protein EOP45_01980 [Sphingobacteriaceae bacterium]|nr:MAG: hypothetical protein EOP45_01980 [Sphingobacteriaceae bacterium]